MPQSREACGPDCSCKGKSVKERFELYSEQLKEINSGNQAAQREVLSKADSCLVRLICEIGLNILKGNIKLSDEQYKELKPHKRLLLSICKPGLDLKKRKSILVKQLAGFLPKVLPFLLPAVSSYLGHTLAYNG